MFNRKKWMHEYYIKNYQQNKEKILKANKIWWKNNKEKHHEKQREWRIKNPTHNKEWRKNNPLRAREIKAKNRAKRKRNLNWIPRYKNIVDESIDWHHINNDNVVAIPRDLHKLYYGEYHRENLKYIVEQIYEVNKND